MDSLFVHHTSNIFEFITRLLDQHTLDALSQVSRDICGRVRMKYYYNYMYCTPPMGIAWWHLSEETGTHFLFHLKGEYVRNIHSF